MGTIRPSKKQIREQIGEIKVLSLGGLRNNYSIGLQEANTLPYANIRSCTMCAPKLKSNCSGNTNCWSQFFQDGKQEESRKVTRERTMYTPISCDNLKLK